MDDLDDVARRFGHTDRDGLMADVSSAARVISWALDEVLTMSGVGFEHGPAWRGDATLELFDSPWDDVATTLPVREILGGYFMQVGTSWDGGTTLAHR